MMAVLALENKFVGIPAEMCIRDRYEGVKFVPYNDPQAWAKAIDNLEKGKRYNPIDISKRSGWDYRLHSGRKHAALCSLDSIRT